LAKDPTGFAAGQANLLQYVNDDPVNGIDPTGLFCEQFWQRALENYILTNGAIPGVAMPTGTGIILGVGGKTADFYGTTTMWRLLVSGFRGATLGGVTYTSLETFVIAAVTNAWGAALAATAFEAGVTVGSLIEAAFSQCFRECQ
jgi:hypothetical protein